MGTYSFTGLAVRAAFATVFLLGFNPFASVAHAKPRSSDVFATVVDYCVFDATYSRGDVFTNWTTEAGLTFKLQAPDQNGIDTLVYKTDDPQIEVARADFLVGAEQVKSCRVYVERAPDQETLKTMNRIFSPQDDFPTDQQPSYFFDAENMLHTWQSVCLDSAMKIVQGFFIVEFRSRFSKSESVYYRYCSDHAQDAAGATP